MKNVQANYLSKIVLFVIILSISNIYCREMWEISLDDGNKYTCTKLIGLRNDSLYVESMNDTQIFSVKNVISITNYKGNVNFLLMGSSAVGGILGLTIENFVKGNGEIDINNNGITLTITGLIAGALLAHSYSINDTINLSSMTLPEKNKIIKSLVLTE